MLDGNITTFESDPLMMRSRDVIASTIPAEVTELQPDIVVLMTTVNDVASREWNDEEGSIGPADPRFQRRMRAAYTSVTKLLWPRRGSRRRGSSRRFPRVLWKEVEMRDPARYEAQHDVIRSVAAELGEHAVAIDVARWFDETGATDDPSVRPDGGHFAPRLRPPDRRAVPRPGARRRGARPPALTGGARAVRP